MYPENNREVVPKLRLRSEQNMETNPSTHPRAVQKTWTIRNRYGHRYAKIHIPPTVSVSDRRRLTGLRTTTVSKRGPLYLGRRWRKASGVVASRCSGETKQCRHDRSTDEDSRGRRGAPGSLRQLLLCKRRNTSLLLEKFGRTSPVRGGFQNLQEKAGTMADVHIWGTMAHTYTNPARRPSTHKRHQGRHPRSLYLFSGEGRGRRRGRMAMCGDDGVDERRRRTA